MSPSVPDSPEMHHGRSKVLPKVGFRKQRRLGRSVHTFNPALGKQRQEELREFQASPNHTVSSRTDRTI